MQDQAKIMKKKKQKDTNSQNDVGTIKKAKTSKNEERWYKFIFKTTQGESEIISKLGLNQCRIITKKDVEQFLKINRKQTRQSRKQQIVETIKYDVNRLRTIFFNS